jgi:hypothetical protein
VLSGPLPKGDALRDRGGHGAHEIGLVVAQEIIACGYGVDSRPQVSPLMERADHPPTDRLETSAMSASLGGSPLRKRGF